jgi:hypothetical protein
MGMVGGMVGRVSQNHNKNVTFRRVPAKRTHVRARRLRAERIAIRGALRVHREKEKGGDWAIG